jgi:hypothetical protein
MPRFNQNDELDFGLCKCGHALGDHDDDGVCDKCECKEYNEEDGEFDGTELVEA